MSSGKNKASVFVIFQNTTAEVTINFLLLLFTFIYWLEKYWVREPNIISETTFVGFEKKRKTRPTCCSKIQSPPLNLASRKANSTWLRRFFLFIHFKVVDMSYRLSSSLMSVKLTGGFYKVSSYLCICMHAFILCNKQVSNDVVSNYLIIFILWFM